MQDFGNLTCLPHKKARPEQENEKVKLTSPAEDVDVEDDLVSIIV